MEGLLLCAASVAVLVGLGALAEAVRPRRSGPEGGRPIPQPPGNPAVDPMTACVPLHGRHLACGLPCLSRRCGDLSRGRWPLTSRSPITRGLAGAHASGVRARPRGERRGVCSRHSPL
jgi:hypothetical protein